MQTKRRAARTGAFAAVALAGSMLAGTTWASSQVPGQLKPCINTLEGKPGTEPGVDRKPRCPLAVSYVPRTENERAAVERDIANLRPAGRRA